VGARPEPRRDSAAPPQMSRPSDKLVNSCSSGLALGLLLKRNMQIEKLMSRDVKTIGAGESCHEAVAPVRPASTAVSASTGCCLAAAPADCLCVDLIRRQLETEIVGFQIYLYQDVDSTNATLRRLAEAGAREGTVVLAEAQHAGRGRRGTPWFSPAGLNLYASVLFRPPIGASAVAAFSFITSLALSDAIWAEGVPATIKWPNDILIEGRKAAGSFGAVATSGDLVDYVILGAGVNLNIDRPALEQGLGAAAAGAISVREAAGRPIDRNRFTAAYLNCLEKWFDVYRVSGIPAVLQAWRERDVLAGRWVGVRVEGEPRYQGRVLGANSEGQLVVQDALDVQHRLIAGEVSVLD
jgi:BirA family transcriptional regulator, biotin operon repressor / biotin---[acetyl-CoA-carboxylase] ligase